MPHAHIVEDDPDSAEMLAELIKADSFSTAADPTPAEAPQRLALHQPDVVLLDLVAPTAAGWISSRARPAVEFDEGGGGINPCRRRKRFSRG
jgi:CheY-like chemotaxis protein